jgi:putative membrane protein
MRYILALHIIFIVTWFAGLFYIVRLFIYMTETKDLPEPERSILQKQYKKMMAPLWKGITWPSAIGTFIFGPWLLFGYRTNLLTEPYFLLKLCFVFGLALYHIQCHVIYKRLQQGVFKQSSMWLRIWNEVASIFLVAIVFIIELKRNNDFVWMALGLFIFASALYIGVQMYKKSRLKNIEKEKMPDSVTPPAERSTKKD